MTEQHLSDQQLWEIVDGRVLTGFEQQHLSNCDQCQGLLQEILAFDSELHQMPGSEPSLAFTKHVVARYQQRVAFPWFLVLLSTIFVILFGISIYMASLGDIQGLRTWLKSTSFTTVVLGFLILDGLAKLKIFNKDLSRLQQF